MGAASLKVGCSWAAVPAGIEALLNSGRQGGEKHPTLQAVQVHSGIPSQTPAVLASKHFGLHRHVGQNMPNALRERQCHQRRTWCLFTPSRLCKLTRE